MPLPLRQGLVLDFGGVLTTPVAECTRAFCLREGLAPDAFLRIISADPEGSEIYARLERGEIAQAEWNERTATLLGVDPTDLIGRVLADLRPEPLMLAAAQAARRAGVKAGILSNSLGSGPYDPYRGYGFDTLYDAVVLSGRHGIRKPEPGIYPLVLKQLQLPAESCVFVDDSARNLPPAQDLGMTTVLDGDPAETVKRLEEIFGIPLR
ncbi:HAD-IA family hydrolase [Streptomyces hiroshimensis]|uniref:Phosphoglycolate phosphatase n=1 Tax=Streptomyces hiroshimensis TaxID=66424 RepID=A0ABQ2Y8U3_9ACTN|nr:HAD-IA family hydrolase [Streptomyces hiroshimensis]GGX72769.1 phosphoglycolate phosphatase [Streptomyces hiroshimensis]